jgi:hypothetical protein
MASRCRRPRGLNQNLGGMWDGDLTLLRVIVAEVRARFERYERALRLPSCETMVVYRGSRRHRNYPDIGISAFEEIASGLHCYF